MTIGYEVPAGLQSMAGSTFLRRIIRMDTGSTVVSSDPQRLLGHPGQICGEIISFTRRRNRSRDRVIEKSDRRSCVLRLEIQINFDAAAWPLPFPQIQLFID